MNCILCNEETNGKVLDKPVCFDCYEEHNQSCLEDGCKDETHKKQEKRCETCNHTIVQTSICSCALAVGCVCNKSEEIISLKSKLAHATQLIEEIYNDSWSESAKQFLEEGKSK